MTGPIHSAVDTTCIVVGHRVGLESARPGFPRSLTPHQPHDPKLEIHLSDFLLFTINEAHNDALKGSREIQRKSTGILAGASWVV